MHFDRIDDFTRNSLVAHSYKPFQSNSKGWLISNIQWAVFQNYLHGSSYKVISNNVWLCLWVGDLLLSDHGTATSPI